MSEDAKARAGALPDWIPAEAWAGYVEMRNRSPKTKMTARAMELRIKDLERFREAGHDVGAILDQSTANSWTDLFEPRERRGQPATSTPSQLGKHGQAAAINARGWIDSQDPAAVELEAKRRFAALFTGLADYYKQEISKAVLALYWEGLKQFDFAAVEKACWAHTQNPDTGMWMPKIADLVRMVSGRTDDQAKVAWAKVDRAVRSWPGVYQTVAFDDALIHRVISDMGGWTSFGSKSEDEWPFVARDFEARYRAFRSRGESPDYPRTLIGMADGRNYAAGVQAKLGVALVGNREEAIAVLHGGAADLAIGDSMKSASALAAPQLSQ